MHALNNIMRKRKKDFLFFLFFMDSEKLKTLIFNKLIC
jgi:hypothetical protein